ncbi:MAG: serine protease [Bacteroidaceae bacterium]|nr:serine protease [Bacteroidaceae bacterium]
MEGLQKVFWIIALAASLVFVIQTVITFIGLGTDMDVDAGPDSMEGLGDSVEDGSMSGLFSFRNLINFLLGYGWAGVLLHDSIGSKVLLQIVAIAVGIAFVAAFVFMFRQLMKLSHDGSFHLDEAIGLSADVYLRIPASRTGRGKVQVSVKGSIHEIDAVTDRDTEIPTGDHVRIVEKLGDDLLRVE